RRNHDFLRAVTDFYALRIHLEFQVVGRLYGDARRALRVVERDSARVRLEHLLVGGGGRDGHFARSPEAARPDGKRRVAVLKLNPDGSADGRNEKEPDAVSGIGYGGQGPSAV